MSLHCPTQRFPRHRLTTSVPSMSHLFRLHCMTSHLLIPPPGSLLPQGSLSSISTPGMPQGYLLQGASLSTLASEAHDHSLMGSYPAEPAWSGHPTAVWATNNKWNGLGSIGGQSQAWDGPTTLAYGNRQGCASSLTFVPCYFLTPKIETG